MILHPPAHLDVGQREVGWGAGRQAAGFEAEDLRWLGGKGIDEA